MENIINVIRQVLSLLGQIPNMAICQQSSYDRAMELIKKTGGLLLGLVPRGMPLGTELFEGVAALSISVAYEMVVFRTGQDGRVEVYMTKRTDDDPAYPGEWHCPGTVRRPWESPADAIERLAQREFGARIISYKIVGMIDDYAEKRGHFYTPVCIGHLDGEPTSPRGDWFPVDQLPENTVKHHSVGVVPCALEWRDLPDIPIMEIRA
ncbi:MAG: NUDIX domain-containing protein [Patescibacteria group bacterium]